MTSDLLCEKNGIIVGANNVFIDGNGFILAGYGGSEETPYAGVLVNGYSFAIIANFREISGFYAGIILGNSSGSIISGNYLANNSALGIGLSGSDYNIITDNISYHNVMFGILLDSSDKNFITGNESRGNIPGTGILLVNSSENTISYNRVSFNRFGVENLYRSDSNFISQNQVNGSVNGIHINESALVAINDNKIDSNWYGIIIENSFYCSLSRNAMLNNISNLAVLPELNKYGSVKLESLNHQIDRTNLVENKSVYYLVGESRQVYDGKQIGEIGMFWCISCNNVTLENAKLAPNNYAGIALFNTRECRIRNVESNKGYYGIYLKQASENVIEENIFNENYQSGMMILDSNNNIIKSNHVLNCLKDLNDEIVNLTNIFRNNRFYYNSNSKMINMEDISPGRILKIGDEVRFQFRIDGITGDSSNPCLDCSFQARLSPSGNLYLNPGTSSGTFSVDKPGYSSLIMEISDPEGNLTKQNYPFYINANGTRSTRYYLRGIAPSHGQPSGSDAKSLMKKRPRKTETWSCGYWVLNSIDKIPEYPFSILDKVEINSWYKVKGSAQIGIQRNVTYWRTIDRGQSIPESLHYSWVRTSIDGLGWEILYPNDWYRIAIKLVGSDITAFPHWQTRAEKPSYADFTQIYPTTPAIKSISNYTKIHLLSATSIPDDPENAQIVIDGQGDADIILSNHHRPFLEYDTSLAFTGAATIHIKDLSGEAELHSVNINILPAKEMLTVKIKSWETSGAYYKKWTEKISQDITIDVTHRVGDLEPNSPYLVISNSKIIGTYLSNSAGEINFSCRLKDSITIFEIVKL